MTILTVFIMLMAVGALAVLGLGQVVWQKEEVQRIADLAAKAAASDIDSEPQGFPAAFDYARENGYDESTDTLTIVCNVRGTNNPAPGGGCDRSVLVRMERNVLAAFLGAEPVVAVAEATVTPLISGIVGTNLLSANLDSGALSPLLQEIGVKLSLNAVGFPSLLQSDLQVDLQQLASNLSIPGSGNGLDLEALLAEPVTASRLLTQAAAAAGLPGAGLGSMNNPALNTPFLLGDIISADQAIEANVPVASVRLGNLAFAAVLSAASLLPQNTLQINLGDTARVSILEPPQLFIAVKRDTTGEVLARARTEQVRVTTRINGVLDLALTTGGGEVDIQDIECRLPQSNSAVIADMRSSLVNTSLDLPSLPSVLGLFGVVLVPGLDPAPIGAQLSVQSATSERFEGFPDPVLEARYSFEASQGLPQLLSSIDLGLSPLNSLLTVLNVNSPVKVALSLLGARLDSLLELLGLGVNEVVVQVDNMDCFNTAVLTR
ncbi:MAG: pilus assembly protein TadG-related protein [Burkholderiales bacterium]|jgi:uncharacterized membrane protein|uniref:pilus assembly protein TadG-related protein n=1 Tax=Limnobacter sp. TaxID=2003368 RepID=UPI0039BD622A|nr:pilus assembly protein TadG-related protein [Burkholderiales bacterium]